MSRPNGFRPMLAGVATLVLVAACGQSGAATPSGAASAATSATASEAASAGASTAPAEAYEVDLATDATLGAHLTGEDGRSLYVLTKDSSGKSTCSGTCAANWPPFLLNPGDTVKAGSGVTGTIASFTRDDGTTQVTINGMPLYYFARDTTAGQVLGQGIGGVWFLAGPTGAPVGASPSGAPGASPNASGGGGYY
jgi:predicted lipoprotein with Yx(FWY)xxD motif